MTKNSFLLFASLVISGLGFTLAISPQAHAQTAPEAALAAPAFAFIFEENVTLADSMHVGATPRGKRNIVPITGGTGQRATTSTGKFFPAGGTGNWRFRTDALSWRLTT